MRLPHVVHDDVPCELAEGAAPNPAHLHGHNVLVAETVYFTAGVVCNVLSGTHTIFDFGERHPRIMTIPIYQGDVFVIQRKCASVICLDSDHFQSTLQARA